VRRFGGDPSRLGIAETFFLNMLDVECASIRMQSMIFRCNFAEKSGVLLANVHKMRVATGDVQGCSELRIVLKAALRLGNKLNELAGGKKTRAITVESLLQLGRTKSFDGKTTLLEFLAENLHKQAPSSLALKELLASVEDAKDLPFPKLAAELRNFQNNIRQIESQIPLLPEGALTGPQAFVRDAAEKTAFALRELEEAQALYRELVDYFGEDPQMRSEVFFNHLWKFVCVFDATCERNRKARAKKAIEAALAAKKAANKWKKKAAAAKRREKKRAASEKAAADAKAAEDRMAAEKAAELERNLPGNFTL
jgi:hypothetical protein